MARGVTARTRALVIARDIGVCQWDGCGIAGGVYSLQHRLPRGSGGTSLDYVNLAGNLVLVAGTGTTGCHGYMESHRLEAQERGFVLRHGVMKPGGIPIKTFSHGWCLLGDDGSVVKLAHADVAEWLALQRVDA